MNRIHHRHDDHREPSHPAPPVSAPPASVRWLWTVGGLCLTGLAIAGALLPVMPSTVFALGAAACFSRSSPRLERWLLAHPMLGHSIRAWREEGAIPVGAKAVAVGSMAVSATVVAAAAPLPATLVTLAVLVPSAAFVASRPAPGPVDAPRRPALAA